LRARPFPELTKTEGLPSEERCRRGRCEVSAMESRCLRRRRFVEALFFGRAVRGSARERRGLQTGGSSPAPSVANGYRIGAGPTIVGNHILLILKPHDTKTTLCNSKEEEEEEVEEEEPTNLLSYSAADIPQPQQHRSFTATATAMIMIFAAQPSNNSKTSSPLPEGFLLLLLESLSTEEGAVVPRVNPLVGAASRWREELAPVPPRNWWGTAPRSVAY